MHHSLQNTGEEPITHQTERTATAAHTRYLSSLVGATLPEKAQGSVPKLPPKTKPLQHPCCNYNAFCNITSQTCISLRTWQHNMATVMQPFHCYRQPQIPNHPYNCAHTNATKQLEATATVGEQKSTRTIQPAHAGTFHRRPEPFYSKKHEVSCPAFSQNDARAISMQPLQCILQQQVAKLNLSTHMATQHGNSHAVNPLRSATSNSKSL